MKPENPDGDFFSSKELSLELNDPYKRELIRLHVQKETQSEHVWFQDEDPPDLMIRLVIAAKVEVEDWFGRGSELKKLLEKHVHKFEGEAFPGIEQKKWFIKFCNKCWLKPKLLADYLNGIQDYDPT